MMLASVSFFDLLNFVLRVQNVRERRTIVACEHVCLKRCRGRPVQHLHVAFDFGLRDSFFDKQLERRPFGLRSAMAVKAQSTR